MTFHVAALAWFCVWCVGLDVRALYCCALCVLVAPVGTQRTRNLP